ncbi:MAG: phosphotransferase [Clostridia bacterium]|nr:phosphotransferase [Clostridia bacterium]
MNRSILSENEENEIKWTLHNTVENEIEEDVLEIEKNEESSDGNVYVIYCKNNKYIAKVYEDKKHAKSMIDLHKKLFQLNINVPNIVYTNYPSENEDKCMVIYSFICGEQITNTLQDGKVEENLIAEIAKRIRKMHDLTCGENEFNLPELPFDACNIRKTLVHFDLTKDNIFLDENNDITIIDFDDAKYGSAIYDVSILISTFFFSKKRGVDMNGMKRFIDIYYGEDDELKEAEVPLIKECAIQWIKYLLDENKISNSLVDSFNEKIKLINENL